MAANIKSYYKIINANGNAVDLENEKENYIDISEDSNNKTANSDSSCALCSDFMRKTCSVKSSYALKGIDLTKYFYDFKNADGSYNESMYATKPYSGPGTAACNYKGYRYSFHDRSRMDHFLERPEKYIPQYGGFCAFGMAVETCPDFPWSADCMGPSISPNHWTIRKGKLYFFLNSEAKELFLKNAKKNIAAADARWAKFYKKTDAPVNSICVAKDLTA